MGAVISHEPLFPSHHGVILQGLAQSLLSPERPPRHLPQPRPESAPPNHDLCPLLSPQGWLMYLLSLQAPKSERLISTFPSKCCPKLSSQQV